MAHERVSIIMSMRIIATAAVFVTCQIFVPISCLAAPAAAVEQKIKIAFAGDSLVDNYWSGIMKLVSADPCLKGKIELGRFARNGTGLTRGDRLYWPREVRRIVDTFKPNVLVLSIGLNDQQFIIDGAGHFTAWGAPDWTEKYRAEVDAFLRAAAAGNEAVLLVGLPSVRDPAENADLKSKNAMYAAAVAALGDNLVHYVEPWKLDAAAAVDQFASYGRDLKGHMVQIRTTDGEHFTDPGENLAAAYLFPKIIAAAGPDANLDQCSGTPGSGH
jgi:hypothetical protein